MAGQLSLDTKGFAATLKTYMQLTRKDISEVLNSRAGDVAYRAEKFQPRADAGKMDALLKVGGKNSPGTLKSGKQSKNKRNQTFQASDYVYAVIRFYLKYGKMPPFAYGLMPKKLAGLRGKISNLQLHAAAKQYVNAKKSSIAYIAVGWLMVARFFGKQVSVAKLSAKGWAYHSDGIKATPQNLTATLRNFSRGADKAPGSLQALDSAMRSVVSDMQDHIAKKMTERAVKMALAGKP
jgi:hypothetical protein